MGSKISDAGNIALLRDNICSLNLGAERAVCRFGNSDKNARLSMDVKTDCLIFV
jgi:hypothetical protein